MRLNSIIAGLVLWAVGTTAAFAQEGPAERVPICEGAEVLVLGVYHMANPGRDVANLEADDVLSTRRQTEIARAHSRPRRVASGR